MTSGNQKKKIHRSDQVNQGALRGNQIKKRALQTREVKRKRRGSKVKVNQVNPIPRGADLKGAPHSKNRGAAKTTPQRAKGCGAGRQPPSRSIRGGKGIKVRRSKKRTKSQAGKA